MCFAGGHQNDRTSTIPIVFCLFGFITGFPSVLGDATRARTLGLLGGIFSDAVSQGYRVDNPCAGVVRPAYKKRKVRLDDAGYKTLGDCLTQAEKNQEPWQAVSAIRVLALTGCRRGEVENLKRNEVDQKGRALRLGDSKTGESIRPAGVAALDALQQPVCTENLIRR